MERGRRMARRRPHKPECVGSIPTPATNFEEILPKLVLPPIEGSTLVLDLHYLVSRPKPRR